MATNKLSAYTQATQKNYVGNSVTVHFATTSANESNNQNVIADLNNNNNNSNNNNQTSINATNESSSLNYCHNQAATRSLLFVVDSSSSSSNVITSTQDSDESITPPPLYHEIPGIVPAYQGRTSGPPPSYNEVVNPNAPPPSYQSLFGQVREARKTSNGLVDLFRQLFWILIGTLGCTMIIGFLLLIPITMILVGIVYVNECRAENIPSFLVIGGLVWIVKNILNCYNQFKKDSSTTNRPPPRRAPISLSTPTNRMNNPAITNVRFNFSNQTPINSNNNNYNINLLATQNQASTLSTNLESSSPSSSGATRTTRVVSSTGGDQRQVNRIRQPSLIGITSFKCESLLNYFLIVWFLAGCIVVYRIYEPDYDNPLSTSYCNRTVYLYAFWLMTSTFIIMAIVLSCLCCLMASSLMSCNHGR